MAYRLRQSSKMRQAAAGKTKSTARIAGGSGAIARRKTVAGRNVTGKGRVKQSGGVTPLSGVLEEVEGLLAGGGRFAGLVDDVDRVRGAVVRTLVALASDHTPEKDLGPFYTTAALTRVLGVSRQALDGRVQRRTLLSLPADDGSRLYPAWQFLRDDDHLNPVPGLVPAIQELFSGGVGPMTVAAWLTARAPGFDEGETAIEHLRAGGDASVVLAAARRDARRWAS